jgi:hypothetical protein
MDAAMNWPLLLGWLAGMAVSFYAGMLFMALAVIGDDHREEDNGSKPD